MAAVVPAHTQSFTHRYAVRYPDHYPRQGDQHYILFEEYRKAHVAAAKCHYAEVTGWTDECDGPLELHHRIIEFALQGNADFDRLAQDYPALKDPSQIPVFVESELNFRWYCRLHHRGYAGVHVASSSDFEAQFYVRNLLTKAP